MKAKDNEMRAIPRSGMTSFTVKVTNSESKCCPKEYDSSTNGTEQ